ncbi:MAG: hypothetical protein A2428_02230 [Bdellovibrionales bacterium RIFOXYC1_FULL_54_43]|nr:MAG: hypothetical protein A2428_02230 [Bdellovibrionales bacterium RIFOXYC1_FULL_54_43]OFZ84326.1 MAG: hypothetical protein A2603_07415 [Bdellovibrionales bacterium RIFOXYD1_FULL_55_31]
MKKTPGKKGVERRKSPRRRRPLARHDADVCKTCGKDLSGSDKALFVEEEVGRIFCSEKCISDYFAPEIGRLEKAYFRALSHGDLSPQERENLAHLRWVTLQEPDEVWREKTLSGDYRYTLISQFQPGNKTVWCICLCLFLRGEPSFLYLSFPTRNAAMVNLYRKGEQIELTSRSGHVGSPRRLTNDAEGLPPGLVDALEGQPTDRLADSWTDDETFRARMVQERRSDDIPSEDFTLYKGCLEETLQEPDEVWSYQSNEALPRLYQFIRHYPNENPAIWYVIIARETEEEEQIEILDAFPTRDAGLVDHYRKGQQEIGKKAEGSNQRVVH